jgi:hypothetical protein
MSLHVHKAHRIRGAAYMTTRATAPEFLCGTRGVGLVTLSSRTADQRRLPHAERNVVVKEMALGCERGDDCLASRNSSSRQLAYWSSASSRSPFPMVARPWPGRLVSAGSATIASPVVSIGTRPGDGKTTSTGENKK